MEDEKWLDVAAPCEFRSRDGSGTGKITKICRKGAQVSADTLGELKVKSQVRLEFRFFATSTMVKVDSETTSVEGGTITLKFKDLQAVIRNMLRLALLKLRDRPEGEMCRHSLLPDR